MSCARAGVVRTAQGPAGVSGIVNAQQLIVVTLVRTRIGRWSVGIAGVIHTSSQILVDYDQLLCIYDPADAGRTLSSPNHSCTGTGHLDSFTTIGQVTKMPAAMTVVDYSEPNQWGRLVKGSREWGTSTYDLDFGHGNHIVTYVLWAK